MLAFSAVVARLGIRALEDPDCRHSWIGAESIGVITYFSERQVHVNEVFLRSLENVGRSLGDFVRQIDAERRFMMTIDSASVGIANRAFDDRWLRVNKRLCEILVYSRDELLLSAA